MWDAPSVPDDLDRRAQPGDAHLARELGLRLPGFAPLPERSEGVAEGQRHHDHAQEDPREETRRAARERAAHAGPASRRTTARAWERLRDSAR